MLKKMLIWALVLTMALLAVGCNKPSQGEPEPTATEPPAMDNALKEAHPAFFDLDTSKGLTVYVAKFAPDGYSCSLYPTTEEEMDLTDLYMSDQTDVPTMKQILASYGLPNDAITVTPYVNYLSSYIAPELFTDGAIDLLRYELGIGEKPEEVVVEPEDSIFPYTLCWADYTEDGEHALRYTYYPITGTHAYQHELTYPAIGIKNAQELESFLSLAKNYFSLNASVGEGKTFNAVATACDEAFFQEKGLVVVYIPSESTSIGYKLADAVLAGEELHITVAEKRPEGELTAEMAGWFMAVEIPQEILSQANYFSAGK